eukprot:TRINITY_DN527_c0_g1_i1.p1 TRINITY_DN527_c0_g1~~TRINITY_DN527_c0_g1_i1.p1  ORF type:complete len:357 (-),score=50.62 TRINITY_DN527_c0_g1_i1:32-961(-)
MEMLQQMLTETLVNYMEKKLPEVISPIRSSISELRELTEKNAAMIAETTRLKEPDVDVDQECLKEIINEIFKHQKYPETMPLRSYAAEEMRKRGYAQEAIDRWFDLEKNRKNLNEKFTARRNDFAFNVRQAFMEEFRITSPKSVKLNGLVETFSTNICWERVKNQFATTNSDVAFATVAAEFFCKKQKMDEGPAFRSYLQKMNVEDYESKEFPRLSKLRNPSTRSRSKRTRNNANQDAAQANGDQPNLGPENEPEEEEEELARPAKKSRKKPYKCQAMKMGRPCNNVVRQRDKKCLDCGTILPALKDRQ